VEPEQLFVLHVQLVHTKTLLDKLSVPLAMLVITKILLEALVAKRVQLENILQRVQPFVQTVQVICFFSLYALLIQTAKSRSLTGKSCNLVLLNIVGKYMPYTGQPACYSCAAGTISTSTGLTTCTNCKAGLYVSTAGNTACVPCAAGFYSSAGAASCSNCGYGGYAASTGQVSYLSKILKR